MFDVFPKSKLLTVAWPNLEKNLVVWHLPELIQSSKCVLLHLTHRAVSLVVVQIHRYFMLGVICLKSCYHLCSPRIFQIESCCPLTTSLKQNWLHRFIFLAAKEPVSLCCGKSDKLVYEFWHLYQVTNTSILT